jgi:hypothetical protein
VEVRKDLGLKRNELPSKDKNLVPMLVEEAALGIIEEGKQIGKQCEAEKMADLLREQKDKGMKEVWKCCPYLYSLESFLYKTLNGAMRLIGSKENEQVWRSKIHTLGLFGLLLWDDPLHKKLRTETRLYRGADLKPEQIAIYEDMVEHPDEYHSFQAFTSCSRNREKAGNLEIRYSSWTYSLLFLPISVNCQNINMKKKNLLCQAFASEYKTLNLIKRRRNT